MYVIYNAYSIFYIFWIALKTLHMYIFLIIWQVKKNVTVILNDRFLCFFDNYFSVHGLTFITWKLHYYETVYQVLFAKPYVIKNYKLNNKNWRKSYVPGVCKNISDFSNIHHCCSADKPQSTYISEGGGWVVFCLKRLCF